MYKIIRYKTISPILGPARAYKDVEQRIRVEVQIRDVKKVYSLFTATLLMPESIIIIFIAIATNEKCHHFPLTHVLNSASCNYVTILNWDYSLQTCL